MRQAVTWILFIGIQAVIALFGLVMWDRISEFYEQAQHELLLDELWADDDDLAESA